MIFIVLVFLIVFLPYIIIYVSGLAIFAVLTLLMSVLFALSPFILEKTKYHRVYKRLTTLCSNNNLKHLTIEEKKKLAELVDLYHHNYKEFIKKWKSIATWTATGYTVAKLGMDKVIRYGLGYVLIRRLLRKKTDDIF